MNLPQKKIPKLILGLDPGTVVSGFGVIQSNGSTYEVVDYGCIRPPSKLPLFDRYLILSNSFEELLHKFPVDAVAIETQFVGINIASATKLARAHVLLVVAARRAGIPVFEYTPMQAKRAVVGNGRASKEQVQQMVKVLLRLSEVPKPEDAADALALACCHAHTQNFQQIR